MADTRRARMEGAYVSYRDIMSRIDIGEGDVVLVSSDILMLMCVCRENKEVFSANTFIDTIIDKIGDRGTLLFTTFNWGFCRGEAFDYRATPSETGALGNAALARSDFRRTRHPIYSFAVRGADQDRLCGMTNTTAWGVDSPFGYCYERGAKNLFIGVDYKCALTYVHYCEQKVGVDYRFFKEFSAPYVDENGQTADVTCQMYVRDLRLCAATVLDPKLDAVLLARGLYSTYSINGVHFGLVDMRGAGDVMEHDIRSGGGLIYPKPVR